MTYENVKEFLQLFGLPTMLLVGMLWFLGSTTRYALKEILKPFIEKVGDRLVRFIDRLDTARDEQVRMFERLEGNLSELKRTIGEAQDAWEKAQCQYVAPGRVTGV